MAAALDALNKEFYLHETAAAWYATKEFVLPEEQAFLDAYSAEITGKAMLDIGVGAGRSTRFLLPLSQDYIGVDYSPDMIAAASRRFPGTRLEVRDARDLSAYATGQFDFVMFSFNGMDCLSHEGRLEALAEIVRVLKPGGLFAFSAHNRARPQSKPWAMANLNLSKRPDRMLRNLLEYLGDIRNWARSRQYAVETPTHALRHDSGNHFKVPMYYIEKQAQVRQLQELGLTVEVIFDAQGRKSEAAVADPVSPWIFFACRKQA
ncbi:MAG: class I SAM-dependent methyltransferase [Prosthecobacter sp.]